MTNKSQKYNTDDTEAENVYPKTHGNVYGLCIHMKKTKTQQCRKK